MKKLLNNPWVAGALALVAIVVVTSSLHKGGAGARQLALSGSDDSGLESDVSDEADNAGALTASSIREIVLGVVISEKLSDPFASAASKTAIEAPAPTETQRVHLSGIWNQAGETLVLINNRICRAGDRLGRVVVESADLEGVWLSHPQGREFLALGSEFTLVTATAPSPSDNSGIALHEN